MARPKKDPTGTARLEVLDAKIIKLTEDLKKAKQERRQLIKDQARLQEQQLLEAMRASGKTAEELLRAING